MASGRPLLARKEAAQRNTPPPRPWIANTTGVAIMLAVLGINLAGDALRGPWTQLRQVSRAHHLDCAPYVAPGYHMRFHPATSCRPISLTWPGAKVVTRFPPGQQLLHIGHAKSVCLNLASQPKFQRTLQLQRRLPIR